MEKVSSIIQPLLDTAEKLNSDIRVYRVLLQKKSEEIEKLCETNFETVLENLSKIIETNREDTVFVKQTNQFVKILNNLNDFVVSEEELTQDIVHEFINHIERSSSHILVIKSDSVEWLKTARLSEITKFFDSKEAKNFKKIIFILKTDFHYSLILTLSSTASSYHYDLLEKKNYKLAELLIFRIKDYFHLKQMIHIECKMNNTESSVFLLENLMKIRHNKDELDTFPMRLIKLLPDEDRLKLLVKRRYMITKLDQIEALLRQKT
ncbi:hypothetical protein PGB90_000081 [Kerria lacca]